MRCSASPNVVNMSHDATSIPVHFSGIPVCSLSSALAELAMTSAGNLFRPLQKLDRLPELTRPAIWYVKKQRVRDA